MLKFLIILAEEVPLNESEKNTEATESNAPPCLLEVKEGQREDNVTKYTCKIDPC